MHTTYTSTNAYGTGTVLSWASLLDANCLEQALAISRVPVVEGHVALMPDAHFGFGPPVGSALRTRDAVMPYAVGVDIGCGMIAARTSLERPALAGLERRILEHIRRLIPSGVGTSHRGPTAAARAFMREHGDPRGMGLAASIPRKGKGPSLAQVARTQFGTLGAGNHFVEVSADAEGGVWLLLHSGSRGVGNQLASAHVRAARHYCETHGVSLEDPNFAYVPAGSAEFAAYLADMLWAQRYAFAQREAMLDALVDAVELEAGAFDLHERINCHHNYAEEAEPGLWLTRKGAIDASAGRLGVIPGSMGAATYIVRGRGEPLSYHTAPHGAGRLLGRYVAKKTLDLDEFRAQMAGRTWLRKQAAALLDEAPSAYKPIEVVIADSAELIEPIAVLDQFINYKGL